ncbi:MAG: DUF4476 domain-containing protein [Flavobacteriales bacterium]
MKQIFTIIAIFFGLTSASIAQTANAVVFSENGDKFTLILNGEKKNDTPMANVKVTGLTSEYYQARIDFEDASLPDFTNKNFMVQKGREVTYVVKQNKKGEYVLRYQSDSEIGGSTASTPASSTDVKVVDYAIEEEVEETVPATNININATATPGSTTTTTNVPGGTSTTTTTTTTTTGKPGSGEKVNVNMNVGGLNMGINMNVEGMDSDMVVEETVVTKTTTTQSTTTTTNVPSQPTPREEIVVRNDKPVGCSRPMDATSFTSAKKSIADKGFDDTRLTMAKQIVKANCMSSDQIVQVMGVFGFEETKLEFAKYAYDYCTDKGNYYKINDAFSFSSTVDELNEYLESK